MAFVTLPNTKQANTLTTSNIMREQLQKLADNPEKSWQRFKLGVALFAIAVGLIIAGAKIHHLIQIPGLLLLGVAFLFSGWGYLGILSSRLLDMQNGWLKHKNKR